MSEIVITKNEVRVPLRDGQMVIEKDFANKTGKLYFDVEVGEVKELKRVEAGGADKISDLKDVEITTPSNGDILKYDSSSKVWENVAIGKTHQIFQIQFYNLTSTIKEVHVITLICGSVKTNPTNMSEVVTLMRESDVAWFGNGYKYKVDGGSNVALGICAGYHLDGSNLKCYYSYADGVSINSMSGLTMQIAKNIKV